MSQYDDELRSLLAEGQRLARTDPDRFGTPDPRHTAPPPAWARQWRTTLDDPVEPDVQTDLSGRRGRPTPTLQPTWIDPEETPFVPVPRPGKAVPARLFSLLVAAAVLGLLAWLIVPEVSFRIFNVNTVNVRDGVLTAQAVPLAPTTPATVLHLFVDAGHLPSGVLPAGTPIARLHTAGADAEGRSDIDLSVPFDARFVSVDTLEGAVTLPGTPVATVYDPAKMYVIVTVRPRTLEQLRRGMRARLTSPVLPGSIRGTVVSAVPLLGTDQDPASSDLVNVRIQPDKGRVTDLVPGIRFNAAIDTKSAPEGAQPLVITAADHPSSQPGG